MERAPIEEDQQREEVFLHSKPVERMNEELRCITNKGKATKNEWKNDD